jgi:hypothetical protein
VPPPLNTTKVMRLTQSTEKLDCGRTAGLRIAFTIKHFGALLLPKLILIPLVQIDLEFFHWASAARYKPEELSYNTLTCHYLNTTNSRVLEITCSTT